MSVWKNIWTVIYREFVIIREHPIYLFGSVGVMLACCIFYFTFFKAGLPSDIPIGVVDMDNSSVSREFRRQIDATQLGRVISFDTFEEARLQMQKGKLAGICVIPSGMYDDLLSSRQPTMSMYVNGLYFVSGALSYKDLLQMVNLTNGAVQREVLRARGMTDSQIMGIIQPVNIDLHQIGNVYTNYGYYLCNILLPGCLELAIIIMVIYTLGMELKYSTSRHLMKVGGDSIITVLTGKMAVYTVLFSAIGLVLVIAMYHWLRFPLAGSIWNMFLDIILLVLASEAVGIFILACLPVPRLALSIGALYSVLGFSFSGFTLPIEAMPSWIQGLSEAFPLRHYYLFYVQEDILGAGFAGWYREVIHLLLFFFLPLPVLLRLKNAFINQNFPKE